MTFQLQLTTKIPNLKSSKNELFAQVNNE